MTRILVPVQLRWSDLDAYSHVNNVEMFRLFEEARIEAFWRHPDAERDGSPTAVLDAGPGAATTTLVARQEIEYLVALPYRRRPVIVELWLGRLGGASVDVCYLLRDDDEPEPTVYARAQATLVLVDATTGAPRRINEVERAAWQPYVEDPIAFRRRR